MDSCAITGHRPTRFPFKYKEDDSHCKRLKKRLREQFICLYERGVRRYLVGGALGVDQWSGEILLKLQLEPEYRNLQLVIALPFIGHDERWGERSRQRLAFLCQHSAECVIVGEKAWRDSFIKRNRYMVDHAPDKSSGHRVQRIDVYYNFIGEVNTTANSLKCGGYYEQSMVMYATLTRPFYGKIVAEKFADFPPFVVVLSFPRNLASIAKKQPHDISHHADAFPTKKTT